MTAELARSVRADIAGPLILCKVAAGAKTEGGDQFLLVNEPELDLAVFTARGQPPVGQDRQGLDPAAVREDQRLARTADGPLDRAGTHLSTSFETRELRIRPADQLAHAGVNRRPELAPKRRLIEPADRRLAGVKLTLSHNCRTAAVDPSRPLSFRAGNGSSCEGFRMPASCDLSTGAEGRRPKACREGTRGGRRGR